MSKRGLALSWLSHDIPLQNDNINHVLGTITSQMPVGDLIAGSP